MIVLDSSACIDLLNGKTEIKKRLDDLDDLLCITSISIYEVQCGLEATKRKIHKKYDKLNKVWLEFIENIQILNFDCNAAKISATIYDQLSTKGQIIDDNDILIVGTMLSNGVFSIITKNINHFNRIDELKIISY